MIVPASVHEIRAEAFKSLTSLKTVQFKAESRLRVIGARAFEETTLETFVAPPLLQELEEGVFRGCRALKSVTLNAILTKLGNECFRESGVTNIEIPPKLTEIGQDAFLGCQNLIKLSFAEDAHLERICAGAFSETGLETFQAPASLKTIEEEAFYLCPDLTDVRLNDSLETLGDRCFWGTGVRALALPRGLESTGVENFIGADL